MAILIVITSNRQSQVNMQDAYNKYASELFIGKPARNIYLMKNNGLALMHAWKEKKRNPFYVDVYVADEVHEWQLPEEVRRSADWKIEKKYTPYPVSAQTLKKENIPSRDQLEKLSLNFSMKSPEKASKF